MLRNNFRYLVELGLKVRKLHLDAVDCALISKRATDPQKKELFDRLADHLAMLASELERAIEAKGP
jgi:hypothetical protein